MFESFFLMAAVGATPQFLVTEEKGMWGMFNSTDVDVDVDVGFVDVDQISPGEISPVEEVARAHTHTYI